MARTEKYFIGPDLLGDVRRVVGRVDGEPISSTITRIPTRLQDVPRGGGGSAIRAVTFTGSWNIDALKVVAFQGITSTPNTVMATNQLFTIGDACTAQVAYIGKVSSPGPAGATAAWHLLNVQHHETAVIVNVTLTTAALEFTRKLTWVPYPGETSTISIQLATDTACS
jgi:hypothetical protein